MCVCVCVYVCVCVFSPDQYFAIPWTGALQAPGSVEFPRQIYWSRLPFPTPRDLPNPGIEPLSPALAGRCFTTAPHGKPFRMLYPYFFLIFFTLQYCIGSATHQHESTIGILSLFKNKASYLVPAYPVICEFANFSLFFIIPSTVEPLQSCLVIKYLSF